MLLGADPSFKVCISCKGGGREVLREKVRLPGCSTIRVVCMCLALLE